MQVFLYHIGATSSGFPRRSFFDSYTHPSHPPQPQVDVFGSGYFQSSAAVHLHFHLQTGSRSLGFENIEELKGRCALIDSYISEVVAWDLNGILLSANANGLRTFNCCLREN